MTEEAVLTPEQQEAEHDRLFNERAEKLDAKNRGDAPPPVEEPVDPPKEELTDKNEPTAEPATKTDADAGSKPAPGVADDKTKAEDNKSTPAVAPKEDELLAELPEERRAAIAARLKAASDAEKKAKDDVRAMAGRVSAYERKYQQAIGRKPEDAAKAASSDEVKQWETFKADYPDVAAGIEARERATRGTSQTDATVEEMATFVREEQQKRFLNDAWAAVDAVHDGWRDKVVTDGFKTWVKTSPTYERLASSDDVSDAIALVDLYYAHEGKNAKSGPTAQETADAAKLAARRTAQADGAKSPKDRGASPNSAIDPNDEEQMFKFYAAKADARMRARGY